MDAETTVGLTSTTYTYCSMGDKYYHSGGKMSECFCGHNVCGTRSLRYPDIDLQCARGTSVTGHIMSTPTGYLTAIWTCPLCDIGYRRIDVSEVGIPVPQNTASLPVYYYDVVMRHCAFGGGCGTAASRLAGLNDRPPPPRHTRTQTRLWAALTFSWALVSFFWTLLATFPAVSPFPKFSSAILQRRSAFGCGNKSNNDRMDRYGDRWGKCINVQWRNKGDKCNYVMLWCIGRWVCGRLSCILKYWAAVCASVTEEDAVRDALKGADAAARPHRKPLQHRRL